MLLKSILAISTIFDAIKMKSLFYILLLLMLVACCNCVYAQQLATDSLPSHSVDSSITAIKDSVPIKKKTSTKKKENPLIKATTLIKIDSTLITKDSSLTKPDTASTTFHPFMKAYRSVYDSILSANKYINIKAHVQLFIAAKKKSNGKEFIFYALCVVLLILGLFKTFYSTYFNNLFRVFLNTSIRQTQLTDQLLQAKLPSLFLNIFFGISAGFYIWILFKHYNPPRLIDSQLFLPFCILAVSGLYFVKYCIIKFMGWIGEMHEAADNYIFVIFLVNKIAGILLIPFIILLAFAMPLWINYLITFSLLMIGLFFISRYIKTYGILEYKFPLNPLHFAIYIVAVEIVPLLLIYKLVVDYVI
jgi:Domain of unknown function (DUF4271)